MDASQDAFKAQQAVNTDTLSYDALEASLMLPPLQLLRNAYQHITSQLTTFTKTRSSCKTGEDVELTQT